jgi:hypothetical protein
MGGAMPERGIALRPPDRLAAGDGPRRQRRDHFDRQPHNGGRSGRGWAARNLDRRGRGMGGRQELTHIYEQRGLKPKLAQEVAGQLMAKDSLDAHAREELGISENAQPKPIQVAFASALAFSIGAALPTLAAFLAPPGDIVKAVPAAALVFLVALGALGAWAGGAPMVKPALRVGLWARWRWP